MKAAVFIDVQNDFVPGGKLAFGYPREDNVPKVIEFARKCAADPDCRIYATRDTHEPTKYSMNAETIAGEPTSGYLASLEGRKLPVEHCVEGEPGWQIVDPLMDVIYGRATVVNKPTFGSFDLVELIAEDFGTAAPDEIVLCGYDLSICVVANAVLLRARFPDAKITVRTGLCGDVDETAFAAASKVLEMQQIETAP